MIAITAAMMPIAKPAFAPAEECLVEPWPVDVAVEDVDVDVGLPPYGQ
jgi:hypothetical protein